MGTSPFRVSAPALRAPLSRILGAVPFEPISGTAGADRRYQLLLTRVTKQGYYSLVMTKIEKHLKRFNTLGFGEESTTRLPLFLSYECFNPGIKDLVGAKVVLVD